MAPGQVFAQVTVTRAGAEPKNLEYLAGQGLKVGTVGVISLAEQWVEIFAGGLVANVHDPYKVIEPNGLDVQFFVGQVDPLAIVISRLWIRVGIQVEGHLDAPPFGQHSKGDEVGRVKLVAQPNGFDPRVARGSQTEARYRIGEVDEPGVGAEALHILRSPKRTGMLRAVWANPPGPPFSA